MIIASALRQRHLSLLWGSQVLSAVGDQLYRIAVIWIAVRLAGSAGGLVDAADSAAYLAFGLLGGIYVDRWNRQAAMAGADILRGLTVLSLPIFAAFHVLQLWTLLAAAVALSALGSLFDPALQASLPILAGDARTLNAANALMDVTRRLARVFGPGLAGLLVAFVPLTQFFSLDGASFFLSAGAVLALGRGFDWRPQREEPVVRGLRGIGSELAETARFITHHRLLRYTVLGFGAIAGVWNVAFTLGAALFAGRVLHAGVGAYGSIVAAYGIGNVASNIVVGNMVVHRRVLMLFGSKIVLGFGFAIMALAPSLPAAMAGAAVAAIGGPMGDLMFLSVLQRDVPAERIGRVYSLSTVAGDASTVLSLAAAPVLFTLLSIRPTIALCAAVMALTGVVGLVRLPLDM